MKTTLRLIGVLTLTCLASGLLLAWVHAVTLEPIAQAEARQRQAAIRLVLPEGPGEVVPLELTDPEDGRTHLFHVRFDDQGRWLALATETASALGYGGPINLMAGVARETADAPPKLSGIHILQHTETPGLGAKIQDPAFRSALQGRELHGTRWRVRQDGGDIQAITAATISSQAVLEALRRAIERIERLTDLIVPPTEVAP